ncbi:hypothetical protein V1291_005648 [Nitrobacteraceae bacterium AZCC 1564]
MINDWNVRNTFLFGRALLMSSSDMARLEMSVCAFTPAGPLSPCEVGAARHHPIRALHDEPAFFRDVLVRKASSRSLTMA